jgi:hypothetical protein
MKHINPFLLTIIPLLAIIFPHGQILHAQSPSTINTKANQIKFSASHSTKFTLRNQCPRELSNIATSTPVFTEEKANKPASEKTVSQYHNFFVYVPKLSENIDFTKFTLQDIDNNNKILYPKKYLLFPKSEVIGFKLPPHPEYSLKIGTQYRWIFTAYCHEEYAMSEKHFSVDSQIKMAEVEAKIKPVF